MYNTLIEEQKRTQVKDDLELLSIVKQFIRFTKNKWKFFTSFLLGGITLGLLYFFLSKPVFESQMSALSWSLDDNKVVAHLEDISKLFEYQDYEQLSQKLNLKPETIKQIVSIKAKREKPEGEVVYEDKERKFGFSITAKVYNTSVLDSLEAGIQYYIESTKYVESRLAAYKTQLSYNIVKTSREIEDLTILKTNLNNMLSAKKTNEGSSIFLSDVGRTSTNIVELHEKLIKLQEDMQLASDFTVIKKFTKFKKRSSPRLSYAVLSGSVIAIIFALFISLFPLIRDFIRSC